MISFIFIQLLLIYWLLTLFSQAHYEYALFLKYVFKKSIYLFYPMICYLFYIIYPFLFVDIMILLFTSIQILFLVRIKVKLKITKRKLRLILLFLILYLSIFLIVKNNIIIYLMFPIFILSSILILPFENVISKHYINKAVNKINNYDMVKIAVTGSFGKTTVKNNIYTCLKENYLVAKTPKSYNTPIGIAKFINYTSFNFEDFLIYEFGARRKNDIFELKKLFNYDIAVITEIGEMHIDTFKNLDNIIEEKMSLVSDKGKEFTAILNYENPYIRSYPLNCNVISYGLNYGRYQARNIELSIFGTSFDFFIDNLFVKRYHINQIGRQAVLNILPTFILKDLFNLSDDYIRNIKPIEHRLSMKKFDSFILLDDSYNSNYLGAKYAIEVLNTYKGIKYIITPGFAELSKIEDRLVNEYKSLLSCVDVVILIKNHFTIKLSKMITGNVYLVSSFNEGYQLFLEIKKPNSILLIENDLPDIYKF